jgi:hypothetical protein
MDARRVPGADHLINPDLPVPHAIDDYAPTQSFYHNKNLT